MKKLLIILLVAFPVLTRAGMMDLPPVSRSAITNISTQSASSISGQTLSNATTAASRALLLQDSTASMLMHLTTGNQLTGDGSGLTNLSPVNIAGITNHVGAGSAYAFTLMGDMATTSAYGGGARGSMTYCVLPQPMTATQLVIRTASTLSTNFPVYLQILQVTSFMTSGYLASGYTVQWSNTVSLPPGTSSSLFTQALPNVTLPAGNYCVFASADASGMYFKHCTAAAADSHPTAVYCYDGANWVTDTNYHACACNITGFKDFGGTNLAQVVGNLSAAIQSPTVAADNVAYSPVNSGFSAASVQGALDYLASGSLTLSNTVMIVAGDSKALELGGVLQGSSWFSGLSFITNVAVDGTHIQDVTNAWAANTAKFSSRIGNGTNGIYVLWTGHNDLYNNVATEIATFSNHLNQVAASNWLPVVITTQARGGADDGPGAYASLGALNNWIRTATNVWRVVDAEALIEDNYNSQLFLDQVHLTAQGYTLIGNALQRELTSPRRQLTPNRQIFNYGTNAVITASVSNGYPGLVAYGNTNQWHSRAVFISDRGLIVTNSSAPTFAQIGVTNVAVEWYSNSVPPVKYLTYFDFNFNAVNINISTEHTYASATNDAFLLSASQLAAYTNASVISTNYTVGYLGTGSYALTSTNIAIVNNSYYPNGIFQSLSLDVNSVGSGALSILYLRHNIDNTFTLLDSLTPAITSTGVKTFALSTNWVSDGTTMLGLQCVYGGATLKYQTGAGSGNGYYYAFGTAAGSNFALTLTSPGNVWYYAIVSGTYTPSTVVRLDTGSFPLDSVSSFQTLPSNWKTTGTWTPGAASLTSGSTGPTYALQSTNIYGLDRRVLRWTFGVGGTNAIVLFGTYPREGILGGSALRLNCLSNTLEVLGRFDGTNLGTSLVTYSTGVALTNGRQYVLEWEKVRRSFTVRLWDVSGNAIFTTNRQATPWGYTTYSSSGYDQGVMHGSPGIAALAGTVTAYAFAHTGIGSKYPEVYIVGDSITEGFGVTDDQSYGALLAKMFGTNKVLVSGVGGAVTAGGLARLAAESASISPKFTLINLGANTDASFSANISALAANAAASGGMVALLTIPTSAANTASINALSDVYKKVRIDLALTTNGAGSGVLANLYTNVDNAGTAYNDGIHPNAAGHQQIANRIRLDLPDLVSDATYRNLDTPPVVFSVTGLIATNSAAPALSVIGATNVVVEWWSNSVPPTKYATYYGFASNVVSKAIVTFP